MPDHAPLRAAAFVCALASLLAPSVAHAYRPFEGTDADVADEGEFELELGPAHYQRSGGDKFLLVPSTVLNLGFAPRWELVVDYRNFIKLSGAASTPKLHAEESDVFLKVLLREGTLQEKGGLSMAMEFGPLLPNYNGEKGYGAQDNLITSYRTPALVLHLNTALAWSRQHQPEVVSSLIVEGPWDWKVRPVAEILVDSERGGAQAAAALFGAIWNHSEHLTFDAALRGSRVDGTPVQEIRAGFTWATGVWGGD
jgi:hypothetical protein